MTGQLKGRPCTPIVELLEGLVRVIFLIHFKEFGLDGETI
jgi:hypothetical protein